MSTNSPSDTTQRAEPETLRARTMTAALTVNNLEKSLAWYRDIVGFTVDQKHEREGKLVAVSLKAGAVRLLIGADDGAKGWDRVKGEGMSLMISTTQDIDEVAARIRSAGGVLETEPTDMPWGARLLRVKDLDGFKLAISSVAPGE